MINRQGHERESYCYEMNGENYKELIKSTIFYNEYHKFRILK